ncbi:translation initiation factor IF-3, mitochondrial [Rhineura floridana]|uniref:translation initiation factor IF-3, mitochondrial n=1 Tax=Rhineura floridana TaxID=261503 RepID=UPI002AC840BF|nr:translation initiation factor IF-3, mitochondrial [Rhineura floridana]
MAALCLKKLLDQARRNEVNHITRHFASFLMQPVTTTTVSWTWMRVHAKKGLLPVPIQAFCTNEDAKEKLTGKERIPQAKKKVESVGRKIPHRIIQLIDENGENQGTIHRADAIRIMDERGVRLVLLVENADPPVYRLMTGQQIHEERIKLREKQKASSKNGPVQQKELTFSTAIAQHDLDAKIKQIQQWIDKKHHVRITVRQKNVSEGSEKMLALFGQILDTMPEKATYLSEPRIVKEGRSTCVIRHMSDREISGYKNEKDHKDNEKDSTESETLKQ